MHFLITLVSFALLSASVEAQRGSFYKMTRVKSVKTANTTASNSTTPTNSTSMPSNSTSNSTSSYNSTSISHIPTNSTSNSTSSPSNSTSMPSNSTSNSTSSHNSTSISHIPTNSTSNSTSSPSNSTSSPANSTSTPSNSTTSPKATKPAPSPTVGVIGVSIYNYTFGYLSADTFYGVHTVNSSASAALLSLNQKNCSKSTGLNIQFADNTSSIFPNLGAVVLEGFEPLRNGSGFTFTVDTQKYPVNSTPQNGNSSSGSNGKFESAIWSLNCTTLEITSSWIDANGTHIPLTQISVPDGAESEYLASVANFTVFNATYPGSGAVPVVFTFIEQ